MQSPAYRDDKSGTALAMLPDLLTGHQGAHLVVRVDGQVILDGPQAVLVSNNPYETGDIAGLGRRARLDQGVLGVVGVKISNAAQAAGLLRKAQRSRSVTVLTAREVVIDADQPQIPVGIDGESVLMPTPVRCTIHPLALRVRVPRDPARRPRAAAGPGLVAAGPPGAHVHPATAATLGHTRKHHDRGNFPEPAPSHRGPQAA